MKKLFGNHKKGIIAIIAYICVLAMILPLSSCSFLNRVEERDTVLNSNVTVFSEKESKKIEKTIVSSEYKDGTLNLCVAEDSPLAKLSTGAIFVISGDSSGIFGDIYFGRIASEETSGENKTIKISTPAVDEVFDAIDLDCNVDMSYDNIQSINAVDGVQVSKGESISTAERKNSGSFVQMNENRMFDYDIDGDDIVLKFDVDILELLKKSGNDSPTKIERKEVTSADEANNTTVYYTKTGLCYHRDTCHCLAKSKFSISLKDAVFEKELRACRICKAPILTYDDWAEKVSASASLKLTGHAALRDISFDIVGSEGRDWSIKDGFDDLSVKTSGKLDAQTKLNGNFNWSISGTPSRMELFGNKNFYFEGLNEKLMPLVFITWNGGTFSVRVGPASDEVSAPFTVGLMLYTDINGNITARTEVFCSYSRTLAYQYDVFKDGELVKNQGNTKQEDTSEYDWYIKAEAEAKVDFQVLNVSAMLYIGNINVLDLCLTRIGIDGEGSIVLNASKDVEENLLETDAVLCLYAEVFELNLKLKYKQPGLGYEVIASTKPLLRCEFARFEHSYSSADIVVDALNYEKPVDVIDENLSEEYRTHYIIIPKLVGETDNIKTFNKKIYDTYSAPYNILVANEEGNDLYFFDYKYSVYKNLIAIAVEYDEAVQAGGVNSEYEVYYYDLSNDEEITFDEYLERLGLNNSVLTKKVKENDGYAEIKEYLSEIECDLNILDALIDDENVTIYYDTPYEFTKWWYAELEMNLFGNSTDIVVDALNYEKDVVPICHEIHGYDPCDFGKHTVILPKIARETEGAKELNKKMYDSCFDVYEELVNDEEDGHLYNVDYEYAVKKNFLGISIVNLGGVQHGSGWQDCCMYYYDIANDKELSFDEYLGCLGLDKEKVFSKVEKEETYLDILYNDVIPWTPSFSEDNIEILGALISDEKTIVSIDFGEDYEYRYQIFTFENINFFE